MMKESSTTADPVKELSISQQQYVETIDTIVRRQGAARVRDIASVMGVKPASVIGALRALGDLGIVEYEPHQLIRLTADGQTFAQALGHRHSALSRFLQTVLGIEPAEAEQAACDIEHVVSPKIAQRFLQYAAYIDICPRRGPRYIKGVGYRCVQDEGIKGCEECVVL